MGCHPDGFRPGKTRGPGRLSLVVQFPHDLLQTYIPIYSHCFALPIVSYRFHQWPEFC